MNLICELLLVALLPQAALPVIPEPQEAGATLTGNLKIKGEIPKRRKINSNADPKCAATHGPEGLLGDEVVADAAGNTQWGFIYVKEGLGEQKYTVPRTPVVME